MYLTADRPFDSRWGFRVNYTLGRGRRHRRRSLQPRLPRGRGLPAPSRRPPTSGTADRRPASSASRRLHLQHHSSTLASGLGYTIDDNSHGSGIDQRQICLYAGRPPDTFNYKSVDIRIEKIFRFGAQPAGVDRVRRLQHLQLDELRLLQRQHPGRCRTSTRTSACRRARSTTAAGGCSSAFGIRSNRRSMSGSPVRAVVSASGQPVTCRHPSTADRTADTTWTCFSLTSLVALLVALVAWTGAAREAAQPARRASAPTASSADDERFLEDLSRRTFAFFWEQADATTGIIRDRATERMVRPTKRAHRQHRVGRLRPERDVHRGRARLAAARRRRSSAPQATLRWFAERMPHERGWFYHFVNLQTGAREWQSELSSIDTALLLAGVSRSAAASPTTPTSSATPTHLPARRLPVDARRQPDAALARLEAGVRIPARRAGITIAS